jgi:hypothetical protein
MESTAIFLGLLIIVLLAVVIYLLFNPTYEVIPMNRHRYRPHPVMPQFGPYWAHGGQANSGLLY